MNIITQAREPYPGAQYANNGVFAPPAQEETGWLLLRLRKVSPPVLRGQERSNSWLIGREGRELHMDYEQTANELVNRIVACGPQILALTSPWELFRIHGFNCDDLGPSLAQADAALGQAQAILRQHDPALTRTELQE